MNKHFGSARRYRLHLLSQNIKNVPEEEVFRKILFEYNSKEQMVIDWYLNLISTAATYQSACKQSKLGGFIQSIQTWSNLQISCFMQDQFECLHLTPYQDRILHID